MRDAKILLEALTKAIPPKPGQSHNLTLHEDKLQLSLMLPGGCATFYLDKDDLDASVGDLAKKIEGLAVLTVKHLFRKVGV